MTSINLNYQGFRKVFDKRIVLKKNPIVNPHKFWFRGNGSGKSLFKLLTGNGNFIRFILSNNVRNKNTFLSAEI